MTTALGATASPASPTVLAGERGALGAGVAAHTSADAPAPGGAARDAERDAALDAEQDAVQHDVPGHATAVAEARARDSSDSRRVTAGSGLGEI